MSNKVKNRENRLIGLLCIAPGIIGLLFGIVMHLASTNPEDYFFFFFILLPVSIITIVFYCLVCPIHIVSNSFKILNLLYKKTIKINTVIILVLLAYLFNLVAIIDTVLHFDDISNVFIDYQTHIYLLIIGTVLGLYPFIYSFIMKKQILDY